VISNCELCEERKGKRYCPAIHGRICSLCCGESRERTLDCPAGCAYLEQAHKQDWVRPSGKEAASRQFPDISVRQAVVDEHQGLLLALSFTLTEKARADPAIRDFDLILALTSLTRSYATLVNSGLYYEAPLASRLHQEIAAALQAMIADYRRGQEERAGRVRPRDAEVLELLAFLTGLAEVYSSGRPKARGFVDFLLSRFDEQPASAPQSKIVLS